MSAGTPRQTALGNVSFVLAARQHHEDAFSPQTLHLHTRPRTFDDSGQVLTLLGYLGFSYVRFERLSAIDHRYGPRGNRMRRGKIIKAPNVPDVRIVTVAKRLLFLASELQG